MTLQLYPNLFGPWVTPLLINSSPPGLRRPIPMPRNVIHRSVYTCHAVMSLRNPQIPLLRLAAAQDQVPHVAGNHSSSQISTNFPSHPPHSPLQHQYPQHTPIHHTISPPLPLQVIMLDIPLLHLYQAHRQVHLRWGVRVQTEVGPEAVIDIGGISLEDEPAPWQAQTLSGLLASSNLPCPLVQQDPEAE